MPELADLTHDYFNALVRRMFHVNLGAESLDLCLTAVTLLPPRIGDGATPDPIMQSRLATRQPFALRLRSEGELGLRQGTYSLLPPDGAAPLSIFIVPLAFEHGGVVYEAVFN